MWKQFGLLAALLLLSQWLSACQVAEATGKWRVVATSAPPPALVRKIVTDKSNLVLPPNTPPLDTSKAVATKVQEPDQGRTLYLVNLRSEKLCGSGGCSYFGYVAEGNSYRKVFHELLDSRLPPSLEFLRVTNQVTNGLPCLEFTELESIMNGDKLQLSRFCYNGQTYKLVNSSTQKNPNVQE